ncbi:MAG: peptide deformylase [Deltaproteobacteria bacterium]|nr:peptide deformylase [Deltaproteobacteria bacterium]
MNQVLTLWDNDTKNIFNEAFLRKRATAVALPIKGTDAEAIKTLIDSFLGREDALGLAAPQIGIGKQIIAFRSGGLDDPEQAPLKDNFDVLINPRITARGGKKILAWEGCLSCPEIQAEVERDEEIKVSAINRQGKAVSKKYRGLLARILQHEIDHLEGLLILDRSVQIEIPKRKKLLSLFANMNSEK